MAENITLNFRVEGKAGVQRALQSVQNSIGGLENTTTSANVALEQQGTTFTDVVSKAAKFTAAHVAVGVAIKGVEKAIRSNTAATAALGGQVARVTGSLGSMAATAGTVTAGARSMGRILLTRVFPPLALIAGAKGLQAAISGLTDFAAGAAKIEPVADAFDNLARHVDTTGEVLRRDLRRAVQGTVPDVDLMRSSVIALNSEAIQSPAILTEIARHARTLGQTVGEDTADSFNRIVRAVGLMNPQLLKQLGVLVSVDEATRRYAKANDRAVSSLSDHERHTAFLQAVMEELRAATDRVGGAQDNLQTVLQQSAAASGNFDNAMRLAVAEAENLQEVNREWTEFKIGIIELNESVLPPLANKLAEIVGLMGRMFTHPLVRGGPEVGIIGGFSDAATAVEDFQRRAEEARRGRGTGRGPRDLAEFRTPLPLSALGLGAPGAPDIPTPALPTKAFADFGDEMERINRLQRAMGDLFDAAARKQTALRQAIRDAIAQGWDPLSNRVQTLVHQLRSFNIGPDTDVVGPVTRTRLPASLVRPSEGGGPEFVGRVPDVDLGPAFETATADLEEGAEAFGDAAALTVASFGSMAEAAIRGSEQMEVSMIRGITSIVQAIPGVGNFAGAIIGVAGGILSAVVGGGGRDRRPQPVRVDEYGSRARQQQREDRGPDTVSVVLVDPRGNEIARVSQALNDRSARDSVDRLPVGTDVSMLAGATP